jgi:CSLREA domain-containing protein
MTQTNTRTLAWGRIPVSSFLLAALLAASLMLATSPVRAATIFTVNSTGDFFDRNVGDGACDFSTAPGNQCSLRAAIQETNHPNNLGPDTIEFEIGGGGATGVKTIRPVAELPQITETVTIDGFSQPGSLTNTLEQGTNAVLNIQLDGTNAGAFSDGLSLGSGASNSIIKGMVINRFDGDGIDVFDAAGVRIEGNFIGTDASGTLDLGNRLDGVFFNGFSNSNVVGGTSRFQRNLISGNGNDGVRFNFNTEGNEVQGNLIGTAKDGTSDLGNDFTGVAALDADDNFVGDFSRSGANVIAFNGSDGVDVTGSGGTSTGGTGNRVLSNSIFDNGGLGIDLVGGTENAAGATANDTGDRDVGPNDLQNKPVVISATTSGGTTSIKARLNSTPSDPFFIQFYANSSGNEGKTLIGSKSVSTDSNGNVTFTFVPSQAVPAGRKVTATALDVVNGNTSEFSAPKGVVAG